MPPSSTTQVCCPACTCLHLSSTLACCCCCLPAVLQPLQPPALPVLAAVGQFHNTLALSCKRMLHHHHTPIVSHTTAILQALGRRSSSALFP
ncbi:hypothetical protein Micbo1qcDRAFT_159819, partial [Microdochium bolleyi]